MTETLAFALAAGALAAVNPCGFVMLPGVPPYSSSSPAGDGTPSARLAAAGRALAATAAMTIGFVAVFGVFGLALAPIASTVQRGCPLVTVVIGVALLVLGVVMLAGRASPYPRPALRAREPAAGLVRWRSTGSPTPSRRWAAPSAHSWSSPRRRSPPETPSPGSAAYAAYAIGMGLVVGVLASPRRSPGSGRPRAAHRAAVHHPLGGALLLSRVPTVGWYGMYNCACSPGKRGRPDHRRRGHRPNRLAPWSTALGPGTFALTLVA